MKKAAIEGDVQAQHSLGLLYFGGYGGLEQSDELSAMWHAAAAAGTLFLSTVRHAMSGTDGASALLKEATGTLWLSWEDV